jgi:hypothetical protein
MQVQWHREACPTGTGHCLSSLSNGPKQIDPLGAKHIFRVLNIFRIDVAERIHEIEQYPIPIGSMYGIYTNIGGILMVIVTIYSIHGSYGIGFSMK